jgi:hypothetical protein
MNSRDGGGRAESHFEDRALGTAVIAARLIGLDENTAHDVADDQGCVFRVVRRDGVSLPVTMDLRSNRINATVENGRVTAVEVG